MQKLPNRLSYLLLFSLLAVVTPAMSSGLDTVLKNLDGKDDRLSDYLGKGKWVLFNIWGPKCPPCLEEVGELVSFHEAHVEHDAMVVSLAIDFPSFRYAKVDEVATFVDEYFVSFPVLLGDSSLVEKVTGERLLGTPTTYLYDPDGELAAVRVGTVTQQMIENYIARGKQ